MLTRTNNMHCSIYYSDKGNVFRFESGNRWGMISINLRFSFIGPTDANIVLSAIHP